MCGYFGVCISVIELIMGFFVNDMILVVFFRGSIFVLGDFLILFYIVGVIEGNFDIFVKFGSDKIIFVSDVF